MEKADVDAMYIRVLAGRESLTPWSISVSRGSPSLKITYIQGLTVPVEFDRCLLPGVTFLYSEVGYCV